MSEMTAEHAHLFVHNVILGILKNESRMTRSVLAAVPNANLDYRPDPHAKTAIELLRHMAEKAADNWFLKSVVEGQFVPGGVKIPEVVKTAEAEIVAWYEIEHAKNFECGHQDVGRTVDPDGRLPGTIQESCLYLSPGRAAPHGAPPWPVIDLLASHGRKSTGALWRKLRFGTGEESRETSGLIRTPSANLRYRIETSDRRALCDELRICPARSCRVSWRFMRQRTA